MRCDPGFWGGPGLGPTGYVAMTEARERRSPPMALMSTPPLARTANIRRVSARAASRAMPENGLCVIYALDSEIHVSSSSSALASRRSGVSKPCSAIVRDGAGLGYTPL